MSETVISVRNLTCGYDDVAVIENASPPCSRT